MTDNFLGYYSFSAWCPLKGQARLSKHAAKSMSGLLVDTKHWMVKGFFLKDPPLYYRL